MDTSAKRKFKKNDAGEKKGPGTYYAEFEGKGKGHRQVSLTHAEELAAARARQYNCYDPNHATPFQMPTNSQPSGFSVALPRHFREDLNGVLFGMAPYWGNMLEAFGVMFERSQDLRDWLGEKNCDAVYASNARFDHTLKMAAKFGDERRAKMLKNAKVASRGGIVVSVLRRELAQVGTVIGANGLPIELTPVKLAGRRSRLETVREFVVQGRKIHWELEQKKRKPEAAQPEKKGKQKREKAHKSGRGKERMTAVRQAIVALAATD